MTLMSNHWWSLNICYILRNMRLESLTGLTGPFKIRQDHSCLILFPPKFPLVWPGFARAFQPTYAYAFFAWRALSFPPPMPESYCLPYIPSLSRSSAFGKSWTFHLCQPDDTCQPSTICSRYWKKLRLVVELLLGLFLAGCNVVLQTLTAL